MRLVLINEGPIHRTHHKDRRKPAAELAAELQRVTHGAPVELLVGSLRTFSGKLMKWLEADLTVPVETQEVRLLRTMNPIDTIVSTLKTEWVRISKLSRPNGLQAKAMVVIVETKLLLELIKHYAQPVSEAEAHELRLLVIDI